MNFKIGSKIRTIVNNRTSEFYILSVGRNFGSVMLTLLGCDRSDLTTIRVVSDDQIVMIDDTDLDFRSKGGYLPGDVIIIREGEYEGQVATVTNIYAAYGELRCGIESDLFGHDDILARNILRRLMPEEDYTPPVYVRSITCNRCGTRFREERGVPEEDANLCEECRKRRYITPYHRNEPKIEFRGVSDDNLYFGVELEVDYGGELDSNAARVIDILNSEERYCYCSHDGSLNNGFEIITMPCTLEYHNKMRDKISNAFRTLVSYGYRGHDTTTAGIHVHFSREYFSGDGREDEHIAKLLFLVERFWDEIIIFSRRDYEKCKQYMKKSEYEYDEYIKTWNKTSYHEGHYYAVNITNKNTIELRMFKSTLNVDTFYSILEFVNKLVCVSKNATMSELQSLNFEDLLENNSLEYYKRRLEYSKFEEI